MHHKTTMRRNSASSKNWSKKFVVDHHTKTGSRVVLVNCNFYNLSVESPPYPSSVGLLYIATILEAIGYRVSFIDLAWKIREQKISIGKRFYRESAELIAKSGSRYICFNTRCDSIPFILRISKKLKQINREIVIILGGPQATLTHKELITRCPYIDVVVRGEAEFTLLSLLKALENGVSLNTIRGITFRDGKCGVIITPSQSLISDLDNIPFPSYEFLRTSVLTEPADKIIAHIVDARGCLYNCRFCSSKKIWRKYRSRSVENILMEIENIKRLYGITNFYFTSDDFLSSPSRVKNFCMQVIERGIQMKWNCNCRIASINSEILKLMATAGCKVIYFGIESGAKKIQERIDKIITRREIRKVTRLCQSHNVYYILSFIIGFPKENISDIEKTLKLALYQRLKSNCLVSQIHSLCFMPGTDLTRKNEERLVFKGVFSDQVLNGMPFDKCILRLIRKFPKLFSSFYGIEGYASKLPPIEVIAQIAHMIINYYPQTTYCIYKISNSKKIIDIIITLEKNLRFTKASVFLLPTIQNAYRAALPSLIKPNIQKDIKIIFAFETTAANLLLAKNYTTYISYDRKRILDLIPRIPKHTVIVTVDKLSQQFVAAVPEISESFPQNSLILLSKGNLATRIYMMKLNLITEHLMKQVDGSKPLREILLSTSECLPAIPKQLLIKEGLDFFKKLIDLSILTPFRNNKSASQQGTK